MVADERLAIEHGPVNVAVLHEYELNIRAAACTCIGIQQIAVALIQVAYYPGGSGLSGFITQSPAADCTR